MPSANSAIGGRPKKRGQSSTISQYHPTPPTKTVGGGGRISQEICRFFTLRAIIWRRGVKSPRKMQVLMSSSGHWGGRGPPVGSATRLVAILNQTTLPT